MKTIDEVKTLLGELPGAGLPLALFPVQIQTRYVTRNDLPELLVRVYPDEFHIDSHEEQLTAAEASWARRYWELVWPVPGDKEAQQRAWEPLAGRFGAKRAAWAVRQITPTNLARRREDPAPLFPDPGPFKAETWTLPAQARLLPDRWVVAGYAGGQRVILEVGAPVPETLNVSMTPEETGPADEDLAAGTPAVQEELAIDDGLRWMVDFAEAERVGMGIRVPLSGDLVDRPLDLLLVFGVKRFTTAQKSAAAIEEQLDGHHYTRGLGFVPLGTPTNNSAAGGSAYSRREPDSRSSFAVEIDPPGLPAGADGALAARLLGISPARFRAVWGANQTEQADARAMATALWPVTGGYYLEQILAQPADGSPGFPPEKIDAARRYFIEFVRHGGPLPALRIGPQPYGILPVQVLEPPGNDADPLKNRFIRTLRSLIPAWRQAAGQAPRLRPGRQNADDLVEVLRMQPVSTGFRGRLIFDSQFFVPSGVMQKPLDPRLRAHRVLLQRRLRELAAENMVGEARAFDLFPAETARLLQAPLVQPGGEVPGQPLAPNYIAFLRTASFNEIFNETFADENGQSLKPDNLLYLLLRHAVLLAYARAGRRILARRGVISGQALLEPALVDIAGLERPSITRTVLRDLNRDPTLLGSLHTLTAAEEPEAAELEELRAALVHLEKLPVDALARQMCGCLDLFAYRLDAWITSLATQRLAALRDAAPRGLAVGGFGWVEDLQPAPRIPVPEPPPGEETGSMLFQARERGGFIQAPSMSQAAAAALLRSGYLTQPGVDGKRPFAVDLSSRRVRLAEWLLDGIRQGQALGALLGYRFERGLHDRKLDRFIDNFRKIALLVRVYIAQDVLNEAMSLPPGFERIQAIRAAQALLRNALQQVRQPRQLPESAGVPELERLAAASVVDGLALNRLFEEGALNLTLLIPGINQQDRQKLEAELRSLSDAVDALNDALTAEGVYQVALGNPGRASATVDMVAHSEIQPPELTFSQTPRGGPVVTHRLAALFSGEAPAAPDVPRPFRARAEPRLNAWLQQMLGRLNAVRASFEYVREDGQAIGARRFLALNRLDLTPLDAVYLTAAAQPGQPSDLERLLEYHLVRERPANVPPTARPRLFYERPESGLTEAQLSLGEFLEVTAAFRKTILAARAVRARDLAQPEIETAPPPGIDTAEFQARASQAVQALRQALTLLSAAREAAESAGEAALPAALETLRERLLDLFFLGFTDALPLAPLGSGPAERDRLTTQAIALDEEARPRLEAAEQAEAGFDRAAADPEDQAAHDLARLRLVFGPAFLALPQLSPANAQELQRAFQASPAAQGGDPLQALSWLQGVSRVRPAAAHLNGALAFAAALERRAAQELKVAQLPFAPNERWVGLPAGDGGIPPGKVSLVAHLPQPFRPAQPLAGLLVDEWVEVIPTGEIATGVSFQYDAPGARPPQAILLALAPPGAERWEVEALEQTLRETLDLVRLRALDPQALGQDVILQRLLPAIYVANNLEGSAISTDFSRAIR